MVDARGLAGEVCSDAGLRLRGGKRELLRSGASGIGRNLGVNCVQEVVVVEGWFVGEQDLTELTR